MQVVMIIGLLCEETLNGKVLQVERALNRKAQDMPRRGRHKRRLLKMPTTNHAKSKNEKRKGTRIKKVLGKNLTARKAQKAVLNNPRKFRNDKKN